jgi:hypothetical protein
MSTVNVVSRGQVKLKPIFETANCIPEKQITYGDQELIQLSTCRETDNSAIQITLSSPVAKSGVFFGPTAPHQQPGRRLLRPSRPPDYPLIFPTYRKILQVFLSRHSKA